MPVCEGLWDVGQIFLDSVCQLLHDICSVQHDKSVYDVVLADLLGIPRSPKSDEIWFPTDSLCHDTYVLDRLCGDSACILGTASASLLFCLFLQVAEQILLHRLECFSAYNILE